MSDPAELKRFYSETVRPLVAYDEQYETDLLGTLSTFLECDANVNATAARLFTHRHTIRYRFERVRELTGLDVSSTDGREKLSLGLKAMRVLGHRAPRWAGDRAGRRGRPGPALDVRRGERLLDCARDHLARCVERLRGAQSPRQHERALERGEHRDRQLTRLRARKAAILVSRRPGGDPPFEHVRARLTERLAGARRLERDRRDRAGVRVVGLF